MMVFDRNGNFLRSWGEGQYPRAHGVHMGPDDSIYLTDDGGHFVRKCSDRGRQGVAGARRAGDAGALYERRAVPPLYPYRAVAEGRHLRLGRLRQCPGPQIFAGRQAAVLVGRARHRSRPVQHRAQHLHRRRRLGLCRRPREPPGPGVRRQRQVRDAVEQSAPAVRPLHGLYPSAGLLYRRDWPVMPVNRNSPNLGPARQHRRQPGQAVVAHRRPVCRHRADLVHRAARSRASIRAATSMSAKCAGPSGRGLFPGQPHPAGLRALQKYERVH